MNSQPLHLSISPLSLYSRISTSPLFRFSTSQRPLESVLECTRVGVSVCFLPTKWMWFTSCYRKKNLHTFRFINWSLVLPLLFSAAKRNKWTVSKYKADLYQSLMVAYKPANNSQSNTVQYNTTQISQSVRFSERKPDANRPFASGKHLLNLERLLLALSWA